MLTLRNADIYIDLPSDAAVTIRRRFEVLKPSSGNDGSYTFPFAIPNTGANRKKLGMPGRTQAAGAPMYMQPGWQLLHMGRVMYTGKLSVESIGQSIECFLLIADGAFADSAKDTKLNQLPITDDFTPTGAADAYNYWNNVNSYIWPQRGFCLPPVYAPNFAADAPAPYNFNGYNGWLNEHYDGSLLPDAPGLQRIHIAQPYLCYVVYKMLTYYGYTITQNALEDVENFRRLFIVCVKGGRTVTADNVFTSIFNFKFLPEIGVLEFCASIEKLLAVRFVFNDANLTVSIIDINAVFAQQPTDYTEYLLEGQEVKYLQATRTMLTMATHNTDPYPFDAVLPENATEVPHPAESFDTVTGTYTADNATGTGKVQTQTTELQYMPQSANHPAELRYDNPGGQIEIYTVIHRGPQTDLTLWDPTEADKFPPKLSFYWGRVNTFRSLAELNFGTPQHPTGNSPIANFRNGGLVTNLANPYQEETITGATHSIEWGTASGLFAMRWKSFFDWYYNIYIEATAELMLTTAQIEQLTGAEKIRLHGTDFVIMAYELTLSTDRLSPVKLELVRV